ncbi:redoxin domain-containing protein [Saxibacter everestensis]|uniref:Redoxin domain-containing protein n=1 Tax=Saxibacter everestensis TaxID=2909229 RepID=A0ABY8QWM1_9MICO|nr:redoxin domain-containing protein [Brevibacteriaceae bacterium ZFBP1038]
MPAGRSFPMPERRLPDEGTLAPDFELPGQFGSSVRLSTLCRDGDVLLVFFPFAFSSVCGTELTRLRELSAGFARRGMSLLTVSVDTKFALRAYAEAENLDFPMLSDFWPHGAVAQLYGVFNQELGRAERGTFLVSSDRRIAARQVGDAAQARDFSQFLADDAPEAHEAATDLGQTKSSDQN